MFFSNGVYIPARRTEFFFLRLVMPPRNSGAFTQATVKAAFFDARRQRHVVLTLTPRSSFGPLPAECRRLTLLPMNDRERVCVDLGIASGDGQISRDGAGAGALIVSEQESGSVQCRADA